MKIEVDFRFDSGHFLPYVPTDHKCKNIHGHTYWLTVVLKGETNEKGWLMDFAEIKSHVNPIIRIIDHKLLNAIPGLENPTVENISKYLYEKIHKKLPSLAYVTVKETPFSRCTYPG